MIPLAKIQIVLRAARKFKQNLVFQLLGCQIGNGCVELLGSAKRVAEVLLELLGEMKLSGLGGADTNNEDEGEVGGGEGVLVDDAKHRLEMFL